MSLMLSVARCGFDSNPGDLRAARLELISAAADIGVLVSHATLGVAVHPAEVEVISKRLRGHRAWLMAQAAQMQQRLDRLEADGAAHQALARGDASGAEMEGRL